MKSHEGVGDGAEIAQHLFVRHECASARLLDYNAACFEPRHDPAQRIRIKRQVVGHVVSAKRHLEGDAIGAGAANSQCQLNQE